MRGQCPHRILQLGTHGDLSCAWKIRGLRQLGFQYPYNSKLYYTIPTNSWSFKWPLLQEEDTRTMDLSGNFRLSQASSEHRKQRLHFRYLSGPSLWFLANQEAFIWKQWPVVSSPSPSWPSLSSPCAGVQRPSCQPASRCCVEVASVRQDTLRIPKNPKS